MNVDNFEYDGQLLSDYDFVVCDFNFSDGANQVDAGSKITFNKVARHYGKNYSLSSTQYDECVSASFDICKNPDLYEQHEMIISSSEYRDIVRWLNRREFLQLRFIYDEIKDDCYYNASFNVSKITINEDLYGIHLEMETDQPFGYGTEQVIPLTFSENELSKTFIDISDEIGFVYPTVTITCNQDGDLYLRNETEECATLIKNCKVGEVITLSGDTNIITTTYDSHDISNDFNYDFFRIGNTYGDRVNRVSSSLPCSVIIKYHPTIKDIL